MDAVSSARVCDAELKANSHVGIGRVMKYRYDAGAPLRAMAGAHLAWRQWPSGRTVC